MSFNFHHYNLITMIHRYLLLCAVTVAPLLSYGQLDLPFNYHEELVAKPGPISSSEMPPPIGDSGEENMIVSLFPNPSNGVFFLDIESHIRASFKEGKVVVYEHGSPVTIEVGKYHNNTINRIYTFKKTYPLYMKIDLSEFGSGRYQITVYADREIVFRQVIVE